MTLSSTLRGGLCGLTLALSFGVAHATDRFVPSQYPTIQAAINAAASSGDRVLVADGTYYEHDIDFGTKNLEVRSVSDNPANCIVDARQLGRGFFINGGSTSSTLLRGFTVRNAGNAIFGGAVYHFSNGTITNCIFSGNSAGLRGAGIYNKLGTISDCLFSGNSAPFGGGLFLDSSDKATNCTFINNSGTVGGGAFNFGGTITNSIFIGNSAVNNGGGLSSSTGTIANCTIVNNSSANQVGGLENAASTIVNCVIYGNRAPSVPNFTGYLTRVSFNLIGDLPSTPDANGNFGADPLFVRNPGTNGASDLGDLRLQWPSPAIDKGNNAAIAGFPTDLDGNARISRALVDLGAYEYQDLPVFIDAGPDQVVTVPHDANPSTNTASVTLAANVYDPEGASVAFRWTGNNNAYPTNVNPTIALPAGVYTFTLTVTEPTGATQTRTVKITVNPEPNGVPVVSDKNVSIKQGTSATVDVTATDPDGDRLTYRLLSNAVNGTASLRGTTLTYTPNAGFLGTERIILGVQDGYGLEALLNVYVTVTDGIAPVITLNGNDPMTVGQGATFTDPGATATDNVDGSVPVDVSGTVDTSTPGSYTLTYTATDAAGNSSTKTRTVNVADTAPPVITLNGSDPMTVAQGSTFTDPGATATDNVDGNIPVQVFGSVNTNTVGSYTLTYTATDAAGNSSSKTRTVNVVDATAPVITLNGDDPMNVDQGATFVDPGATATDNVDGNVPVSVSGTVNTATPGSYTLTYTATDSAGNSSTKTRTVVVKDTTAPVITLNGSDPMSVTQGSTFTDPGATATDNVDGNVPVSVSGSVNTATVGSYTLTYTATDAAGNRATRTRTVNVVAPISSSKIVVSLKELESDDDCGRGRDGGEVEAEFVLRNTGTVAEDNVTITSVSLGGKSSKGRLPKRLGTIRAGRKEDAEFEFKGVRRGTYTLTLSGTSNKGSFSFTQTVTIR